LNTQREVAVAATLHREPQQQLLQQTHHTTKKQTKNMPTHINNKNFKPQQPHQTSQHKKGHRYD
jgi:hypothetical protein